MFSKYCQIRKYALFGNHFILVVMESLSFTCPGQNGTEGPERKVRIQTSTKFLGQIRTQ